MIMVINRPNFLRFLRYKPHCHHGLLHEVANSTKENSPQISTPAADRDQPVSRRFEPSSRTSLIGEQPNPWELLHPQDEMSRHRGAEQYRRYGLLDTTSLLSPE